MSVLRRLHCATLSFLGSCVHRQWGDGVYPVWFLICTTSTVVHGFWLMLIRPQSWVQPLSQLWNLTHCSPQSILHHHTTPWPLFVSALARLMRKTLQSSECPHTVIKATPISTFGLVLRLHPPVPEWEWDWGEFGNGTENGLGMGLKMTRIRVWKSWPKIGHYYACEMG